MRRPEPPKRADSAVRSTRLHITMDGAYLRKSTASTATKIRICGVICSMPTWPQTRESVRPVGWSECLSTPAAASHLAAIPLPPCNSSPCRCRMRATPRRLVRHSRSAWAGTFADLVATGLDEDARPTSASSAYPHPMPVPWHRSHRAGPTLPPPPTVLPAAAIAPRAYFAIPPIAAAPALHRPDKPPFPVPCRRRASCPWHTLAVTNDRGHAGLPETHDILGR